MNIKKNIETLFKITTNYRIYKDTGIAQTTLGDYSTGKSKIGNMKLDHALILNDYFIKNREMLKVEKVMNEFKEIALPGSWEFEGMKIITSLNNEKEVIEEITDMYTNENDGETASQFVLYKLEQEDRVRDWDYYEGNENEEASAYEDGFIWVDEIDKWVKVD